MRWEWRRAPIRSGGNPTGRIADPRDMGRAAVFLSSDASSFITGLELFADGGMAQV
ncbi:SDR family oxidoreductase [Streptomyces sp. NPDC019890]|uniref:SDR family oxidoreductase n=1 Tax=Streptomyces sp. NPDC019890 TaxID=3365064 RepID=UPI00384F8B0C